MLVMPKISKGHTTIEELQQRKDRLMGSGFEPPCYTYTSCVEPTKKPKKTKPKK